MTVLFLVAVVFPLLMLEAFVVAFGQPYWLICLYPLGFLAIVTSLALAVRVVFAWAEHVVEVADAVGDRAWIHTFQMVDGTLAELGPAMAEAMSFSEPSVDPFGPMVGSLSMYVVTGCRFVLDLRAERQLQWYLVGVFCIWLPVALLRRLAILSRAVLACVLWWWTFLLWADASVVLSFHLAVFKWTMVVANPMLWPHLRLMVAWLTWALVSFIVDLAVSVTARSQFVRRKFSRRLAGRLGLRRVRWRTAVLRFARAIRDLRLPTWVRSNLVVGRPSMAYVERGRRLLEELGWPVNVDMMPEAGPSVSVFEGTSDSFFFSATNFSTGIRRSKLQVVEGLAVLNALEPKFERTEEYQSEVNELESTARYFRFVNFEEPVDVLMDVWEMVKPIFKDSRLTSFSTIQRKWKKKYALGFWMQDSDAKHPKKMSRRKFIKQIGLERFQSLWAETFRVASMIMPVAHISVKGEALPPLKRAQNKVRSIIGSPIAHYIASTVVNYWPNHHFDWVNTPISVGMPLTGQWMGKVFDRHATKDIHCEGDITAFDSSLAGPVKKVILAVRKLGFVRHPDYASIAALLDVIYAQLDNQLLGHTSTGDIYFKGSGFTTGHSATSMDNSVGLVTFYMMAWKILTGRSAAEFKFFNELTCFGDDHLLSISGLAPRAWTPANIQKVMFDLGVENRIRVDSLDKLSFLSKFSRPATTADRLELDGAGLFHVNRIVWHNKARLIGKLTAKLKNTNPTYVVKRLQSYLALTAHHPDIYAAIVNELGSTRYDKILAHDWGVIPSYQEILRQWYAEKMPKDLDEEVAEDLYLADEEAVIQVGLLNPIERVAAVLSFVPDFFNPVLFNAGPVRAIQRILGPHLAWVPRIMGRSNGVKSLAGLETFIRHTPYNWLEVSLVPSLGLGTAEGPDLIRHWLFQLYLWARPTWRMGPAVNFLVHKLVNLQWFLNAHVTSGLPSHPFDFDKPLVAAGLGFCPFPKLPLSVLYDIRLPDLQYYWDVMVNVVLASIWSLVPADFGELDPLVSRLLKSQEQGALLIQAPTGVGKSTTMMVYLARTFPTVRKLIVIEPRALLAIGLAGFINRSFSVSATAGAAGSILDPSAKIWYMTPASFMMHIHLIKDDFLIVLDEAHLPESHYAWFRENLHLLGNKIIWTTATPGDLVHEALLYLDIPLARLFETDHQKGSVLTPGHYFRFAMDYVNSWPPFRKILVILDTPEECERAAQNSRWPSQCLSSKHAPNITNTSRYFATSVVDVGVTIPDIELVIGPNWNYAGRNQRYALTETHRLQRAGRTGRTSNGVYLEVSCQSPSSFEPQPEADPATAWRDFIAAGVPIALAAALDPVGVSTLYGVDMPGARDLLESKNLLRQLVDLDRILTEWNGLTSKVADLPRPVEPQVLLKPASGGQRFSTRHKGFNNVWSFSTAVVQELVEAWHMKRDPSTINLQTKLNQLGLGGMLTSFGGSAINKFRRVIPGKPQARPWRTTIGEALCFNQGEPYWDQKELETMLDMLAALPSVDGESKQHDSQPA